MVSFSQGFSFCGFSQGFSLGGVSLLSSSSSTFNSTRQLHAARLTAGLGLVTTHQQAVFQVAHARAVRVTGHGLA